MHDHHHAGTMTEPRTERAGEIFAWIGTQAAVVALAFFCWLPSQCLRLIRRSFPAWAFGARFYHPVLTWLAAAVAWSTCHLARRRVPAYVQMLRAVRRPLRRLRDFPETSKDNYVRAYPLAEQSAPRRGRLIGATVDESSGSTGVPYNWMRSGEELTDIHLTIANYIRVVVPTDNLFCINAFSMGAWGTGINFSAAMRHVGIVKSVGPDVDTVIATMRTFGPRFDYLITAYPPFLKNLCDAFQSSGFPVAEYRLYGLVAGEPMTETLRAYLLGCFRKVMSGYGASDVGIAIAGETDLTVALRQAMERDHDLRHALLGPAEDRLPMIFQYNPMEIFIEVNAAGELVFTTVNAAVLCQKLRYNVKDEGRILSFGDALTIVRRHAPNLAATLLARKGNLRLPLLFLYGRSDSTISIMGSNIYPQDVEHALYADARFARHVRSFCLSLEEHDLTPLPTVNVELYAEHAPPDAFARGLEQELAAAVTGYLVRVSRDFAAAHQEDPCGTSIRLRSFARGQGPFASVRPHVKNHYLVHASGLGSRA